MDKRTIRLISDYSDRMPLDLIDAGVNVERWSQNEFLKESANIDIFDAVFVDCHNLHLVMYNGFMETGGTRTDVKEILSGDPTACIVFYNFDIYPLPEFVDPNVVVTYKVKEKSLDNQNIVEPPTEPQAPIQQQTPVQQVPVQPVQPVQQPIQQVPVQQPIQQAPVQQAPVQPVQPQAPVQQPIQQAPVQQPIQQASVQPRPAQPVQSGPNTITPTSKAPASAMPKINVENVSNLLQYDDYDSMNKSRKAAPANVILFGSSKGGTGKTFTCLSTAYWYAKKHPEKKIALADFDVIDGQVGISLYLIRPTLMEAFKQYKSGNKAFSFLEPYKAINQSFSSNIVFYLAPPQDIPAITNDTTFWKYIFDLLLNNYDTVFFDSGIDYIGKEPISMLYKIADKIFITCNPSINSVKSIIKQIKTLSGERVNSVFAPKDMIKDKLRLVFTRMNKNEQDVNNLVVSNFTKLNINITATFGNIDPIISQIQWYQRWELIDKTPVLNAELDKICKEIDT